MKRFLKNSLSIFLALSMIFGLFSCFAINVAAEKNYDDIEIDGEIWLDGDYYFNFDDPDQIFNYTFTPEESGYYHIFSLESEVDAQISLWESAGVFLDSNESYTDDYENEYDFGLSAYLNEGYTYRFQIELVENSNIGTTGFRLVYIGGSIEDFDYIDEGTIDLGDELIFESEKNEVHQFYFSPQQTGWYEIYAFSEDGYVDLEVAQKRDGFEDFEWISDSSGSVGNKVNQILSVNSIQPYPDDIFYRYPDYRISVMVEGKASIGIRKANAVTNIEFIPVQDYVLLEESSYGHYDYDEDDSIYYRYDLSNYSSGGFATGDKITLRYDNGKTATYTFRENEGWKDENDNQFFGFLELYDNQSESHWDVDGNNVFWYEYNGVRSNEIPVTIINNPELDGKDYKYEIDDGEVFICKYTGNENNVIVPSTLEGYPVVGIKTRAFYKNEQIQSITLPLEVRYVNYYAFSSCKNLKTISFSDNIRGFDSSALEDCVSLTDIYFDGSESSWNSIEFSSDMDMGQVKNGESCIRDANIHYLFNSENICGDHVAYTFDEKTGTLTLSGRGYTWDYSSGEDDNSFFCNNTSIKKIIIEEGIISIGSDLFFNCSKVETISLPQSLQYINQGCFWGCESLKTIYIPSSVCEIGPYVFYGCEALKDVYYEGSKEDWDSIFIYDEDNDYLLNATFHYGSTPTPHEHIYTSNISLKPTCTNTGIRTFRCSCGDTYTEVISALGHNYGAWSVKKEASCSSVGEEARICKNDSSHIETRAIAKKAHTPGVTVKENVKAATCTATGSYEGVVKCSVCNTAISRTQQTVPALGHAWGVWKVTKAATCTEAGTESRTCTRDASHVQTQPVPATGHHYSAKVVKPTAGALGYTLHTCSKCQNNYKDKWVAPTGKVSGLKCKTRKATEQTLTWKAVKGACSYVVKISDKTGKKWEREMVVTTNSCTVKKLKAGCNYKFKVKFSLKAGDGKKYHSNWSATMASPSLPTGTTLTKLTGGKKCFTAQWKKAPYTGYQIQYSTNAKFTGAKKATAKEAKKLKATIVKLSSKKVYYVRIRTYKTISKVHYFSTWSKVYKVKTK